MKALIVKTSSLGDILHTFAAVTDAAAAVPDIRFDWVVEESFAEVPPWHPAVDRVIPVATRRWRREPWRALRSGEVGAFHRELRRRGYDCIIDGQGLMKSALISRFARGPRCGLDGRSAREPLAALAYHRRLAVSPQRHAVDRLRALFAQSLGYAQPTTPADFGFVPPAAPSVSLPGQVVFLHGTTWATKLWPEAMWLRLARLIEQAGLAVCLPWGNAEERARAERIAGAVRRAWVLPTLDLAGMAAVLGKAEVAVGVDTGLGHLAAALGVPLVTVYGATDPARIGTLGPRQVHLQANYGCAPCRSKRCREDAAAPPCYLTVTPEQVWAQARAIMRPRSEAVNL
jgi:heptosyltransferase-1